MASTSDSTQIHSRLDPQDIELIAARVAELLDGGETTTGSVRLVDAAAVAAKLGVDRDWVYAHARALGGVRLGGPQGRLRFDLQKVEEHLQCPERQPPRRRGRPPRRRPLASISQPHRDL